jgi:hypothetical protein
MAGLGVGFRPAGRAPGRAQKTIFEKRTGRDVPCRSAAHLLPNQSSDQRNRIESPFGQAPGNLTTHFTPHDRAVNYETGRSNSLEASNPLAILRDGANRSPGFWRQHSRFIMIRPSTFLPAFVIAFGLATFSVAMADQSSSSSSNNATPGHPSVTTANSVCASSSVPDPQDCYPPDRQGKRALIKHS